MSLDKHGDKHEDKLSIKFTDYAINKHQTNFDNIKGKSAGVKLENCGIKGLKLIQYKKTKKYRNNFSRNDCSNNSWYQL